MNKFEKICVVCAGAVCLSVSLCFMVFSVGLAIRLFRGC